MEQLFLVNTNRQIYQCFKRNQSPSLSKLNTFIDALRVKFKDNHTLSKHVAVVKNLYVKIYITNKRERYGIKIYMLCESSTAWLFFEFYCLLRCWYRVSGITPITFPEPFEEYKNPSKVVLLLKAFFQEYYRCVWYPAQKRWSMESSERCWAACNIPILTNICGLYGGVILYRIILTQ